MKKELVGNTRGLAASQRKSLLRLYERQVSAGEIVSFDLARELYELAEQLGRMIGVLINRRGNIEYVLVGTKNLVYMPDLGRFRFGRGRLRRLRLVVTDLSPSNTPVIASDISTDLEKLRFDLVAAIKFRNNRNQLSYAHLAPATSKDPTVVESVKDVAVFELDFLDFIQALEQELDSDYLSRLSGDQEGAVLVGVYQDTQEKSEYSMAELKELSRTAGVTVLDTIIQRRRPDPKTLLGRGKLEETVLHCLRLGAGILIFDCELLPFQWRIITNSTELKVLDRSMLILDIFAQRATTSTGRLQVELAQLRYNLPRLVEKDAGLSRLTGGIGGRGPGETKLEIGRRRIRDRITRLEKEVQQLKQRRSQRRTRRKQGQTKVCALVGYTNAGKSTLFNAFTKAELLSEDKLFATLETTKRRLNLPLSEDGLERLEFVLSDTVGFIRDLPAELERAFEATLDELHEADVLLHIVDASEEGLDRRMKAVAEVIERLELFDTPQILVFNKIDLLPSGEAENLIRDHGGVAVSAEKRVGFDALLAEIATGLNISLSGKDGKASNDRENLESEYKPA